MTRSRIAVLLPCFNEGAAIRFVVGSFRSALPGADIYVYDNNSTDNTTENARLSGAIVRYEPAQGKGNVCRRMFADIDADVYVLADGDGTYDAQVAPRMVAKILSEKLDMVIGTRVADARRVYPWGHAWGNRVFSGFLRFLFGRGVSDALSGFRVMSRRFVKSFPSSATGFEIEMDLNVHALNMRVPLAEVETVYRARVGGTKSKLRTFRDGFRILGHLFSLFRHYRPMLFFAIIACVLFLIGLVLGLPLVNDYLASGLVLRIPTAIIVASLGVSALLAFVCGLILATFSRGQLELKRLAYLQCSASIEFLPNSSQTLLRGSEVGQVTHL